MKKIRQWITALQRLRQMQKPTISPIQARYIIECIKHNEMTT